VSVCVVVRSVVCLAWVGLFWFGAGRCGVFSCARSFDCLFVCSFVGVWLVCPFDVSFVVVCVCVACLFVCLCVCLVVCSFALLGVVFVVCLLVCLFVY